MNHDARVRYACFLGKLAVALVVAWFVLVLVAGCATYQAPPPSCDLSANRDLCELEQRINRIEQRARALRLCQQTHGADSILCDIF